MKQALLLIITLLCMYIPVQAQVTKTVDVKTPGTLTTLLTEKEKASITELTVTGTIDARDFKTIRDELKNITKAHLGAATIAAYTGSDGTALDGWRTNYGANAIPPGAFSDGSHQVYGGNEELLGTTFREIVLPTGATSIGNDAFGGCRKLVALEIPPEMVTIGDGAFDLCVQLASINLPNSVRRIGSSAFARCKALKSVTLPQHLTSIENWLFQECKALEKVVIPAAVITVGRLVFTDCSELKEVHIYNPVPPEKSYPNHNFFDEVSISAAVLYVPAGSESIYQGAGEWCLFGNIQEMGSGEASKTIHIDAPGTLCRQITDLEMGSITQLTVTGTLDARDFVTMYTMPGLAHIDISRITIAAFNGRGGPSLNEEMEYPANELPWKAFGYINSDQPHLSLNQDKLKSIQLPVSITSIARYAFQNSQALTTIEIPAAVTHIDRYAFAYAKSLEEVIFIEGSKATLINHNAFYQCTALKKIAIPEGVTELLNYTFSECEKLTEVKLPASLQYIGSNAFSNCTALKLVSIAKDSELSEIDGNAFTYCTSLENFDIPESVMYLHGAFSGSGLTSIFIPKNIEAIDRDTFWGCEKLATVTFDEASSVTFISNGAFRDCISLKEIIIPATVTGLGEEAFKGCTALANLYVGNPTPADLTERANVFYEVDVNTCVLHVPVGSLQSYKEAAQWKDFMDIREFDITGNPTVESLGMLRVYPNPTEGIVHIKYPGNSVPVVAKLFDGLGRFVLETTGSGFDISHLSQGVYFLRVNKETVKVIKK